MIEYEATRLLVFGSIGYSIFFTLPTILQKMGKGKIRDFLVEFVVVYYISALLFVFGAMGILLYVNFGWLKFAYYGTRIILFGHAFISGIGALAVIRVITYVLWELNKAVRNELGLPINRGG